jgi:nucleotide-binding universal stress UspA family protein
MDERLQVALTDELARLGRSLLYIAQARARKQGVQAEVVVHHGKVQESLEQFVRQVNASTLVVGSPQTSAVLQAFRSDELNTFVSEIEQATGVEVVVEVQSTTPVLPGS